MARPKSDDPTQPITLRLRQSLLVELERRADQRKQNVRTLLQDAIARTFARKEDS